MVSGLSPAREYQASEAGRPLRVRWLGQTDYLIAYDEMRAFTRNRTTESADELWLLEHPPVFTQGQAGRSEHLLDPGDIPVVQVDRGGQVTYHGPGQLVAYLLLDLRRAGLGVRQFVSDLECTVTELLATAGIVADTRAGAPGVYVGDDKIAALGLRVSRHCCYHGLSLNVSMDLEPFSRINPCGYPGLGVTSLQRLGVDWSVRTTARYWLSGFCTRFGYAASDAGI